jgi:hypothetical protein
MIDQRMLANDRVTAFAHDFPLESSFISEGTKNHTETQHYCYESPKRREHVQGESKEVILQNYDLLWKEYLNLVENSLGAQVRF